VAADLTEAKETLESLLSDDKAFRGLRESVDKIKRITTSVNGVDGSSLMFAMGVEFKNSLKDGFIAISHTYSSVRGGKGSVGQ